MRESTLPELNEAVEEAAAALPRYSKVDPRQRAQFLSQIATNLENLGDDLLSTASAETNLPIARLTGERARTCGQLRMFASLIEDSRWMDIRIDPADPTRTPAPRPEIRRTQVPLGVTAVFGASNFPLAFSVPGGDTASALAAGCPVVCKAHPSHEQTSQLCANAIMDAAKSTDMPDSTFRIVFGGPQVGRALVEHPLIAAVGFTGSLRGGRALFDYAASRSVPIPVFAEMGSVNPVFLLPTALDHDPAKLAQAYAASLTLGVGQFCTNPGVLVGIEGSAMSRFMETLSRELASHEGGTMLDEGILSSYRTGVAARKADERLNALFCGGETRPAVFTTTASEFIRNRDLQEELFGPAALIVRCSDEAELMEVAASFAGQLTATVHFAAADHPFVERLLPTLERFAGRIVANGWPTGVEVGSAMHHGGPYPATTDSRATSVGTAAIYRWVRPVAFQDFPLELLPPELQHRS